MARNKEIRARVDSLFAAKVEAWSQENGYMTVSDYLRELIQRDMASGGIKAGRKADSLSELTAQISIQTGLMVGHTLPLIYAVAEILSRHIGPDDYEKVLAEARAQAKDFEVRTRGLAMDHIQDELLKTEP